MPSNCSIYIEREPFNTDKDYKRKRVIEMSRQIMMLHPGSHGKVLGMIEDALNSLMERTTCPLVLIKFNGKNFISEEQYDCDLGL